MRQVTISKTYNMSNLLDDIRIMYKACGQHGKKTTFLFTEAEIKEESFLEVLNSILTTGEVSNLLPKDELMAMASELRTLAIKQIPNFVDTPDNLVRHFVDRVRSNLHVVLCMSPVGPNFSERARRFPGIKNVNYIVILMICDSMRTCVRACHSHKFKCLWPHMKHCQLSHNKCLWPHMKHCQLSHKIFNTKQTQKVPTHAVSTL